ncbi:MAG: 3-hydroxyacyl-ACP dehydratase FabZ [Tumebacillaceae bacterium]
MSERTPLFQTPIDIVRIMQIVPQKYPFLYVDRVLELEPGVSAVGLKNVTINEDYFPGHFVHEAVIPGTIFVEIAAQLTGIINASVNGTIAGSRGMIVKLEDVKARAKVVPGDQLICTTRILETNGDEQVVEFTHAVDGKIVSEGKMTLRKK